MNTRKTGITIVLVSLLMGFTTHAQQNETTKFSIEIDPATFVLKGFSAHLRIQPKNCDHLLVGIGAYALDIPDLLVDINSKNKNQGWDVRLNQGYSVFAEHHFSEVNKKLFVGVQLSAQEYKLENENSIDSEKFTNGLAMGYFGYTLKPFKNNLYFKPWAGIGYTSKISGENQLNGARYDIASITMFATLHIGYTF